MKNEEKAVKLFNGVTGVGDDLIEEAGTARKRKKTASWRWGLVAACLCLVLVGTAGAVAYQLTVRMVNDDYVGYQVYGETVQFSLDDFSPELIAAYEGNRGPYKSIVQPRFATKEETWRFIGHAIPCVWAIGGDEMSAMGEDYKYGVSLSQNDETGRLDGVQVRYYVYSPMGISISVGMTIFAETIEMPEDWDGVIGGRLEERDSQVERLESYTMSNGAVAEIVKLQEPYGYTYYYGIFTYKGILYQVGVGDWMDYTKEELVPQLHTVLDSFQ